MLENYFKIAWRNLWKNKAFSFINILGLALGIASTFLIAFHVKEEVGYDKGFSKANRIYRITQEGLGTDNRHWAATSPPMGTAIQQSFPEVESIVRFNRPYPYQLFSYTPQFGEIKRFEEKGGFFADENVVDVFDLSFIRGNKKTALSEMNAIVVTQEMAKKYFGDADALGKTILDERNKQILKVTGVIESFPFNTHLHFDYLLSMRTITNYQDQRSLENRTWNGFYTYVLLNKNYPREKVERRFPEFTVKYFEKTGITPQQILSSYKLHLQPITEIHLYSNLEKEMYPNSNITYVYIFSVVALFILIVAGINFINISTTQAFNRMKEIGMRKVIGASRQQLLKQFLGESFFLTIISTLIAVLLFEWSIPFYNNLTANSFNFNHVLTFSNLLLLLLLIVIIALLSGLYPAWFVSNFNAISSLQGKKLVNSPVNLVRKGLIVFQFIVSVFMIFCTVIIYRQMQFFHNKDLGFDKEQLVAVTMYDDMWKNFSVLTNDIEKYSAISSYSIASTLPGERFSMQTFTPLSTPQDKDLPSTRTMWSDEKLLPVLKIPLKEGRNFFNQSSPIRKTEFIINEAAVNKFQIKNAVGKKFVLDGDTGNVVGVVKDFNFASLHAKIEPMVIQYNPFRANYLLLKIRPNQLQHTLQFMESKIKMLSPSSVFSYTFINDKLNQLYESENRMSLLFKVFAAFALFISSLGLFGLSAYSAKLRIKEVGIRRVLGASIFNVTILLSRNFIKLVLTGTLIAWPLAWWAMSTWLNGFAYRIDINIWVFIISGAIAVLVGMCTVSSQAIKTSLLNPVDSVKSQ